MLPPFQGWRPIGQATMAYGYGLSMTPLQLAQAYAVLAGDGLSRPVSLVRVDKPPIARRVVSPETARNVVAMLEQVVTTEGTGIKADGHRLPGCRQDRHGPQGGGRRLRPGPAHGGVRRTRAGDRAAPGHRGRGRRAEGRRLLRRRRGGAGVLGGRRRRPAHPRGAARRRRSGGGQAAHQARLPARHDPRQRKRHGSANTVQGPRSRTPRRWTWWTSRWTAGPPSATACSSPAAARASTASTSSATRCGPAWAPWPGSPPGPCVPRRCRPAWPASPCPGCATSWAKWPTASSPGRPRPCASRASPAPTARPPRPGWSCRPSRAWAAARATSARSVTA